MPVPTPHIVIIGAGIAGLSAGALLAKVGYRVTILEAHTYPGGCAGTFYHKGYRFDAGATVAGGFQPNGPHTLLGQQLGIDWPVHRSDPAWIVHLPDCTIPVSSDMQAVGETFPESIPFWTEQTALADIGWSLSAQGLPWPPQSWAELRQLINIGIANFPRELKLLPFAFRSVYDWLKQHNLHHNPHFVRFIDAQLLISAQTTSHAANAIYSATALDLARQGVYHIYGGMGGIAETLATKFAELGGDLRYRHRATRIGIENGNATGVYFHLGRHSKEEDFIACDFVLANLTPWSLNQLLGKNSPRKFRRAILKRQPGWGAFVLHIGVDATDLPNGLGDHHQIIADMDSPLGEGTSVFVSLSPIWDETRAPTGHRAVTATTHTDVQTWWDLLEQDRDAYEIRKQQYTERILNNIERGIPGFRSAIRLILPGTPVTYQFYTGRHRGMVGGFSQTSLLGVRGPRTGIRNMRLVGDSIFPGQSTAGVTLGAMRVAADVKRQL